MSGKGDPRIYYREHVLTINTPKYIHSVPGIYLHAAMLGDVPSEPSPVRVRRLTEMSVR